MIDSIAKHDISECTIVKLSTTVSYKHNSWFTFNGSAQIIFVKTSIASKMNVVFLLYHFIAGYSMRLAIHTSKGHFARLLGNTFFAYSFVHTVQFIRKQEIRNFCAVFRIEFYICVELF